jgi:hypothetical protein
VKLEDAQTQWLACVIMWKRDRNQKTAAALKRAEEAYCAAFYVANSQNPPGIEPWRPKFKRLSKWMDPYATP